MISLKEIEDFMPTAQAISATGLRGIVMAQVSLKEIEQPINRARDLLRRIMPQGDQAAAKIYERHILDLELLCRRIDELVDGSLSVYKEFQEAFEKNKEIHESIQTRINNSVKKDTENLIDTALCMERLSFSLKAEPIALLCLSGFSAFPIYDVIEEFDGILEEFCGRKQGGVVIKGRFDQVKQICIDQVRSEILNLAIPRLSFIMKLMQGLLQTPEHKWVKEMRSSQASIIKSMNFAESLADLKRRCDLAETLIQKCTHGIRESGDVLALNGLAVLSFFEMPGDEPPKTDP